MAADLQKRRTGTDTSMGRATYVNRILPVNLRWISSIFRGWVRHRTTVPFNRWPEDSCSFPRKTMKSFSRLYQGSLAHNAS